MPVMSFECSSDFSTERQATEEIWSSGWPQTPREFEALVDNVLDRLVWHAFRMLRSVDDAEDAVQEVLVRVYADRVKRSNVQRVVPYLYRMVANACLERRRRDGNRPAQIDSVRLEDIPDEQNDVRAQVAAVDELQWIEQILSQLPPKQAEVIRLRVIDDLPLTDIAEILGCSLPTAKSRLCYGLRKLRVIVPNREEGNR
jgi:RNA polymerase sigma-70 factor (ECF subfamily)